MNNKKRRSAVMFVKPEGHSQYIEVPPRSVVRIGAQEIWIPRGEDRVITWGDSWALNGQEQTEPEWHPWDVQDTPNDRI